MKLTHAIAGLILALALAALIVARDLGVLHALIMRHMIR
jgi:hypothetical protein